MGDLVKVHAKACKAELRNGGTPDLTARHVKAHPARAATAPGSLAAVLRTTSRGPGSPGPRRSPGHDRYTFLDCDVCRQETLAR